MFAGPPLAFLLINPDHGTETDLDRAKSDPAHRTFLLINPDHGTETILPTLA